MYIKNVPLILEIYSFPDFAEFGRQKLLENVDEGDHLMTPRTHLSSFFSTHQSQHHKDQLTKGLKHQALLALLSTYFVSQFRDTA